ncbi:MAG: hypothetical protein L3J74_13540 [Bacteroidales bacterium]|nr:hypothetical protein [Bacteroidales bacterium]
MLSWENIDRLENSKQYEQALILSKKLYIKADSFNDINEIYKSIIYQIKLKSLLKQPLPNIIRFTEKEADKAKLPLKNILHSLIVDLYLNYYQNNQQHIKDNICIENLPCENLQDWSLNRLRKEIIHHILQSLSEKEKLQAIKTNDLATIIMQSNKSENNNTKLYDFLAYKALNFLGNKQWRPLNDDANVSIPDSIILLPAKEFVKQSITTENTLSPQYLMLKIYKELVKEYLNSEDINDIIYTDLKRIKSIKNTSEIYPAALQKLIKEYEKYPKCSEFYYLLAEYHYQNQKTKLSGKSFNNNRIKAVNICTEAINKYPGTIGAKQCSYLKSKILTKSLDFSINEIIISKDSFDIDLNYQNIDTVYIKIAKIEENKLADLKNKYFGKELYKAILKQAKTTNISTHILHQNNDYYPHTTKIHFKSLPIGKYLIFVANNKQFSYQNNITAYADFRVSNLSYISKKLPNGNLEYYLIDRKSGSPMENVQVKIYEKKENYKTGKVENILISSLLTNKNGHFIIEADKKTSLKNLYLEFKKGKGVLITKQPVLLYPVNNHHQEKIKIEIITDKNYYQSGEMLYFKALALKTDNKTADLIPKLKIPIIIKANKAVLSEKIFTSNEFASISGQFKIPEHVQSGELEIYTPYGSKFVKLNIQPPKNTQKTNISINENRKNNLFKLTKSIRNDTIIFTIDSKEEKLNLLYKLIIDNKTIVSKWLLVSKKQEQIKLPLNKHSSVKVILTSIKNNTLTTSTEEFNRACLNKKLTIEIENFKTENISSSNVSWKIRVHDMQNNPVESELLVFLSEDKSTSLKINRLFNSICSERNKNAWSISANKQQKAKVESQFLNQFLPLPFENIYYLNLYGFRFPKESSKYTGKKVFYKKERKNISVNLPKTEFFFPTLKSDAKGSINLTVNIPKTTNEQYLNILAISKNAQFGYSVKTLSIKKILKIESSKPAFYRTGDLPVISTKLINNSLDTLKGRLRLLLYQNGLKEILQENEESDKYFIIPPKQAVSVSWKIKIPETMNNLKYKIEAKTEQYIDIEQNSFKILNMRRRLNTISDTLIRRQISAGNDTIKTVKYTNIYVNKSIQIVNNLSNTLSKNAIDIFLNYFTNSIKSQYLNNVEDKRLHDLNLLASSQNKNGSWSWFQNMPEDFEISSYILGGFGRMKQLKLIDIQNDINLRRIVLRSIFYLDKEIAEKYSQKNNKTQNYHQQINYLYARSFFTEIPISQRYKPAFEFYRKELEKNYKNLKPDEKLMLAIIAHHNHWQFEQNIKNKIDNKLSEKIKSQYLHHYIEYLFEYNKADSLIKKYFDNLILTTNSSQKSLANTLYILLLNNNYQNTDIKLFSNTNQPVKSIKQLKIKKEIFKIERRKYKKLSDKSSVSIGDTLTIKIIIKSKKQLKYLRIEDNYAAAYLPIKLSNKQLHKNQLIYYQDKDTACINYYIYQLNKGVNIIEYQAIVKNAGQYTDKAISIRQIYNENNSVSSGKEHIIRVQYDNNW